MSKCKWYVVGHAMANRVELFYGNRPSCTILGPFDTEDQARRAKDEMITRAKQGEIPKIQTRKAVINVKERAKWMNPRPKDKK